MDNWANAFTRYRKYQGGVQYDYLDYMLTYGIDRSDFRVCKTNAKSDHMKLKMDVSSSELGSLIEKGELNLDFNSAKNDSADISNEFLNIFCGRNVSELTALVKKLRKKNDLDAKMLYLQRKD